jgi:hypothetical protein
MNQQKETTFYSKTISTQLENKEGELNCFIISLDFHDSPEGYILDSYKYFPKIEDLRDSVLEVIENYLKDIPTF